jgi:hypothetical protein
MDFRTELYKIYHPINGVIIAMAQLSQDKKDLFITNERNYYATKEALEPLVNQKYLSITRKGNKVTIKILDKAKKDLEKERLTTPQK